MGAPDPEGLLRALMLWEGEWACPPPAGGVVYTMTELAKLGIPGLLLLSRELPFLGIWLESEWGRRNPLLSPMVESGDRSPLPQGRVCNYKTGKLVIGSACKKVDCTLTQLGYYQLKVFRVQVPVGRI